MTSWMRAVVLALVAMWAGTSAAHEMTIAELELRETTPNQFIVQWAASERGLASDSLTPVWPEGCDVEQSVLRCGAEGLRGELAVKGVGQRYSATIVRVFWRDGSSRVYTVTAGQPTVHLYGGATDLRGGAEIAKAYVVLGVEHILSGIDHLLFVVSLLFLVSFRRRLIWTITAFTVAHSLTLASAALGWLTLRSAPVEACIALSIVLVAAEGLRDRDTVARRWPALVAFLFGLVHGLGFAGALQDIGLPQNHLAVALVTFNLGVEAGQLLVVGGCWALWALSRRAPRPELARTAMLYAIGGVAAWWSMDRIATIVS